MRGLAKSRGVADLRTLLIACGNTLRCDDGVAHLVLRGIAPAPGCETRFVQQLMPELAQELTGFGRVVFLDADARCMNLVIEPLPALVSRSPLTHAADAGEIVALARALFGFTGEAFVCRIPARDFSPGGSLSPVARRAIDEALGELRRLPA